LVYLTDPSDTEIVDGLGRTEMAYLYRCQVRWVHHSTNCTPTVPKYTHINQVYLGPLVTPLRH